MKHLFLSILLSSMSIISLGQLGGSNEFEEDVPKEGKKTEAKRCGSDRTISDCNEVLEFDQSTGKVFHKKTGKPFTGKCETCHDNNNRQNIASFKNGNEDGISITYYADGSKQNQRSFVDGVEHGDWIFWYPAKNKGQQGFPAWENTYANGKLEGKCIWYFKEDGSEKKIENYKEGQLDGTRILYFKPGIKKSETNYTMGTLNGSYITYFRNDKAQVSIERTYKMGKEDGPIKHYFDNGQLSLEGMYKNGKKDGRWKRYFKNGVERSSEVWNNGRKEGQFMEFYEEDGNVKSDRLFENNKMVSEKLYDEFGNSVDKEGNKISDEEVKEANRLLRATVDANSGKKKKKKKKTKEEGKATKEDE